MGLIVGLRDGFSVIDGVAVGTNTGVTVGAPAPGEGWEVGDFDGMRVGSTDGFSVGKLDGSIVGIIEGEFDGLYVG